MKRQTCWYLHPIKKKYNVGEKAIVSFPSSEGGRALISIENGSKVIKTLWATTKKGKHK